MLRKYLSMLMVMVMLGTSIVGCARLQGYRHTEMPTITVPKEPAKPEIKAVTVKQGENVYVGYSVPDALRLYKFLLEKDAYEDKLIFRIEEMNKLIKEFGKVR